MIGRSYKAGSDLAAGLLVLAALATAGSGQTRPGESLSILTKVARIRHLSPSEANRKHPIRLRGVITYHSPEYHVTFFQDQTAGIFIFDHTNSQLSSGSLVEVTGNTTGGDFAPSIEHAEFRVLGRAPLPVALRRALGELMSGIEDSQWVAVRGIVHAATLEDRLPPDMRAGPRQLVLEIASGTNSIKARVQVFRQDVDLTDAIVTVRGVCGTLFNQRRQIAGVQLFVPSLDQVVVDRAPAPDAYVLPVTPIGSLLQFNPSLPFGRRTHIRGIVTLSGRDGVFVQDDTGGVLLKSEQPMAVMPGDLLDVAGFPTAGVAAPVLSHARYRKAGRGAIPAPRELTAANLRASDHDSELIQISGQLLTQSTDGDYRTLTMEVDGRTSTAGLESRSCGDWVRLIRNGSRLRITGVSSVQREAEQRPASLRVLLRSDADIKVLDQGPWLSGSRMLRALGALLVVFLLSLLWGVALRRRVELQTATLRAVLESTEDGILAVDREGRVVARNDKFNAMWRIPDPLARTSDDGPLLSYVTAQTKDPAAFLSGVRDLYRDLEVKVQDMVDLADGRVFLRYSEPQRLNGKCVGRVWGFRDVTERQKADQHLRSLSAAVEQSPVSIVITDLTGRIEYVNPKFSDVSGYKYEEVLGKNPKILRSGETSPEEYRQMWETLKAGVSWKGEFLNRRKNRELYWETATICTIRDRSGAPSRYLAVKEDITERRLAGEALQESEKKYRGLFEHMFEGVAYCSMVFEDGQPTDFIYLDVNRAFATLTGLKDVVGKRASQVIPGLRENDYGLLEVYGRVARTGVHEKLETRVESMDMWFSISLYSPEQGFFVAVFDVITERKRAEAALKESEEKYRAVIETTGTGYAVVDTEGRVLEANSEYLRLTGRASSLEILGKRPMEWTADHDLLRNSEAVQKCVREGVIRNLELDYVNPQGQVTPVEINATMVTDARGARIVAMCRDISERKHAERALRESEWKYRTLVEHLPQRIFLKDRESVFVSCNDLYARDLGISAAEIKGKVDSDFYPREFAEKYRQDDLRIMEGGVAAHIEERHISHGRECIVFTTKAPVFGADGNVTGVLGMFTDITERKHLERQLAQAQKLESLGQLAAGIAHEINTPIQYIGDNAVFLAEAFRDLFKVLAQRGAQVQPPEGIDVDFLRQEVPAAIDQLKDGVAHVARIVRAMKEFSHPGPAEKSAVDIRRALESTIIVSMSEWKYVAEVTSEFDPLLPPVPCVAGEINQVFLNLIVNAAHAIGDVVRGSSRKGTITVSTRRHGGWAEIRVKDTGSGIPESVRSRVFDPFFTTKDVGKGTGQGLTIAHAVVVQKHQGTIEFETSVGTGTTFLVRLPIE